MQEDFVSRETMFHVKHFLTMDKEFSNKLKRFNRRINTMIAYSGDNLTSIDQARQGLKMIYGKEMVEPKATVRGLSEEKRKQLESVVDAYLRSPESTIPSYKAIVSAGFKTFASNKNLSHDDVLTWSRILRSSEFQRIKELNTYGSKDTVDLADKLVNAGLDSKQVITAFDSYLKSNKESTLREWIDNIVHGD